MSRKKFPIPAQWQIEEEILTNLGEILGSDFEVLNGSPQQRTLLLYDSCEHHLLAYGAALVRGSNQFRIVSASDLESDVLTSNKRIRHHRPLFWWDFEPGEFQQILRTTLELRAAQFFGSVSLERREVSVRNRDGKIIFRFCYQAAIVNDTRADSRLFAQPLRGYDKEAAQIYRTLSQSPDIDSNPSPLTPRIYQLVGKGEIPMSPKSMIQLKPTQTAQDAVTHIASIMLKIARQNEPGILDDIDTEYLHDYRVALRGLRSVLSLVKGAYPKEDTRRLKQTLRDLSQDTNRLRDLDVYLLKEKE